MRNRLAILTIGDCPTGLSDFIIAVLSASLEVFVRCAIDAAVLFDGPVFIFSHAVGK